MDIAVALLQEHSSENMSNIAKYIGNDEVKFKELMGFVLEGEGKHPQYASWVMMYCAEKYPRLFVPYIADLLPILKDKKVHDGVKRTIVRTLQTCELPEELRGEIYEACFLLLTDPDESIAVKAFSITVLHRIALFYPELAPELCLAIEQQIHFGSTGLKNRGRKILALWGK